MHKGLEVYWTRLAEYKLDEIFLYYESKAGIRIAKKLVNGIIDRTLEIEDNPKSGQAEALLLNYPQEFRYLVYKSYKINYWINIEKKRIEISTVFDTRQDPNKILS